MEFHQTWTDRVLLDVTSAARYAAEAIRLLRRHPSLLLFPLLIAAFGAVESGVGGYLQVTHTAYGREAQRVLRHLRAQEPSVLLLAQLDPRRLLRDAFRTAAVRVAGPAAEPSWQGVELVVSASVATNPPDISGRILLRQVLAMLVLLLVTLPVNALVVAGYYGLLCEAAQGDTPAWRSFRAHARRRWSRFLALLVLQAVVGGWLVILPQLWISSEFLSWITTAWIVYVAPALLFFLALVPVLVTADNVRFGSAVRESVSIISRHLAVPVVLLVGLAAASLVLSEAREAIRWTLFPSAVRVAHPSVHLTGIPLGVVLDGAAAVLGAWAAATLFTWWFHLRPAPARPETATETPAP